MNSDSASLRHRRVSRAPGELTPGRARGATCGYRALPHDRLRLPRECARATVATRAKAHELSLYKVLFQQGFIQF